MEGDDGQRVIRTPTELYAALVQRFLDNADAGDHAANDALIHQLTEWRAHHDQGGTRGS